MSFDWYVLGQQQKRNDHWDSHGEELENGGHGDTDEKHDVKKHKGILDSEREIRGQKQGVTTAEDLFQKLQYCS
jgi:hypothetical protein